MIKITGYERKQGEYEGRKYDNTLVYFITDTNVNVIGFKGSYLKMKTALLSNCLGCDFSNFSVMLNRKAEVHYDLSVSPPTVVGISLISEK